MLLPPSVLDFIPAGHLVHFVLNLLREQLDLSAILVRYQEARGYPPFHPVMMVGLLLYSYSQGNLFITANRESLPGADRFHGAERDATSGFSNDQLVSLAASGGVERPVWASAEIVPKSGSG